MTSARCPFACESLESRRQCSATVGLDTTFHADPTQFGGYLDTAEYAVPLSGGRLLVAGLSLRRVYNEGFEDHNAFAMYDSTGKPVPSFNHGGTLVQSAEQYYRDNGVEGLAALPDGSALVLGDHIRRLQADGTFDAGFGTRGALPAGTVSPIVHADGTISAFDRSTTGKLRVVTFDKHGRPLAATPYLTATGVPSWAAGGRQVLVKTNDDHVSLFNADLTPITSFGGSGTIALDPLINKYVATHGPWFYGLPTTTPQFYAGQIIAGIDGGFVVQVTIYAQHDAKASIRDWTSVNLSLDATGKTVSIKDSSGIAPGTTVTAGTGGTINHAAFHFLLGGTATLDAPSVAGYLDGYTEAADGSFYLLGRNVSDTAPGEASSFVVIHTKPIAAHITGTVFSDTNANRKVDSNEAKLAGRVVYLDTNDNGKLDVGEARTTTDAVGRYAFSDIGPGQYIVRRVLPAGYRLTTPVTAITVAAGARMADDVGSIPTIAGEVLG